MKKRAPVSYILMCIVLGLIITGIIPAFFIRASETPKWFSAFLFISILVIVLLSPVSVILGLLYRTDDPKNRKRNRIGLWSSLVIVAGILGLILFALFTVGHSGYGMPGIETQLDSA
jgi:membrane protease YdiL (CAAX protease family)